MTIKRYYNGYEFEQELKRNKRELPKNHKMKSYDTVRINHKLTNYNITSI